MNHMILTIEEDISYQTEIG